MIRRFCLQVNKGKPNSGEVPGNSVTAEIVTVGPGPSRCTDPLLRVAQLEQNIRFLQEQHQQMLSGLHQEIDSLRQKNRGQCQPLKENRKYFRI